MRAEGRIAGCVAALLLGCGLCASVPASAAYDEQPPARSFAGDSQGRDRIIDAVQRRYHARVVRVAETTVNGRPALELRLLSEQRVFNIVVDAATGQVLSGG